MTKHAPIARAPKQFFLIGYLSQFQICNVSSFFEALSIESPFDSILEMPFKKKKSMAMFPPISAVSVSNSTGFVVGFGFSFEHGSTTKFSLNFDHFKNKITLKLVENVGGFGPDFGTVALPLSWLSIAQLFN